MNVRWLVLSLLAEGPKHGYAIRRWLTDSHASLWADVKPFSIHHALTQLASQGFARPVGEPGARQRQVYEITDAGREELAGVGESLWRDATSGYPGLLYLLLTFGDPIAPGFAARVDLVAARLRAELARWDAGEAAKSPMPDHWRLMFDNGRAHLRADLALLESLHDVGARARPGTTGSPTA